MAILDTLESYRHWVGAGLRRGYGGDSIEVRWDDMQYCLQEAMALPIGYLAEVYDLDGRCSVVADRLWVSLLESLVFLEGVV